MKKFLIFNLLVVLFFSCNFNRIEQKNESIVIYDIIFADFFDSDEIVFTLNGDKIMKRTLKSDKAVGLTGLTYQIVKKRNNTIVIVEDGEKKEHIISDSSEMDLSIFFNNKWYHMKLKENLGRYILIDGGSIIRFTQQERKPIFD